MHLEDAECMALVAWASITPYRGRRVIDYLVHIPNGGKRGAREAGRFKRMGTRAGFPDYLLHVAQGGSHGLFIELKRPSMPGITPGRISGAQSDQLIVLASCGYQAHAAWGWLQAKKIIEDYLGLRSCAA